MAISVKKSQNCSHPHAFHAPLMGSHWIFCYGGGAQKIIITTLPECQLETKALPPRECNTSRIQ